MANKFTLKGHAVEIDYTIGANPSLVALTLKSHGAVSSFRPAEITTEQTDLGQLVSMALAVTAGSGGSRFGFFLPQAQLNQGQSATVSTVGVFESGSGPDSVPQRPATWRCVELQGTAETVAVPLARSGPA